MEKNAITNVLRIVVAKAGLLKYIMKYFIPAQSPPVSPLVKS